MKKHDISSGARAFAGFTALCCALTATVPAVAHNNGPVAKTNEGWVQGFKRNGVQTYLGIPYAAPPVGKLRWQPPRVPSKWKGTLEATEFGSVCPQVTMLGVFATPNPASEDCLFLNVFTTGDSRKKKPVIVWIHGGGNVDGASNDYDGGKLATGGPNGVETVVVTINYRLGLFGFMSNPALNSEGHLWGNYGILDIQAALRWVQRNISAFGGDPRNVTLGGQSAGARNTSGNLVSPQARGLFHHAIVQSYPDTSWLAADVALTRGTNFGVAAGCPGSGASAAACLRDLSTERILQLQGTPNGNGPFTQQIMVDGTIVPVQPQVAWSTGQYNQVPIMTGGVHDDNSFGVAITQYFAAGQPAMTEADYLARVTGAALAQYPLSAYGNDPSRAYTAYTTDSQSCRTLYVSRLFAQRVPLYTYEFLYQDAPYFFPKMTGFKPLASHTIDIQFLFPGYRGGSLGVNLDQTTGLPRDLNAREKRLSDELVATWTNFAATGNPNLYGNSPWSKFTTGSQKFYGQNISSLAMFSDEQYAADHKCGYWFPVLGF